MIKRFLKILTVMCMAIGMFFVGEGSVVKADDPSITWAGYGNNLVFSYTSTSSSSDSIKITLLDLARQNPDEHKQEINVDSTWVSVDASNVVTVTIPWGNCLQQYFSGENSFNGNKVKFIATVNGNNTAELVINIPDAPITFLKWGFTAASPITLSVTDNNYLSNVNSIGFDCGENHDYVPVNIITSGESANVTIDGNKMTIPTATFSAAIDGKTINSINVDAVGYMNYHKENDSNNSCTIALESDTYTITCQENVQNGNHVLVFDNGQRVDMLNNISQGLNENILEFTNDNLRKAERGTYIPGGTAFAELSIDGKSYPITNELSLGEDINKDKFALKAKFVQNTGVVIECITGSDGCYAYLQYIDDNQFSYPGTTPDQSEKRYDQGSKFKSGNSGVILRLQDNEYGPQKYFPSIADKATTKSVVYDKTNHTLTVPIEKIIEQNVPRNTPLYVCVNAPIGYAHNNLANRLENGVDYHSANELLITSMEFEYENDEYGNPVVPKSFDITYTASDKKSLRAISNVNFVNSFINKPNSSSGTIWIDDMPAENLIDNGNNSFTIKVPTTMFSNGFAYVGTAKETDNKYLTATVEFNNYDCEYASEDVKKVSLEVNPFKKWPLARDAVDIKVVAEGILFRMVDYDNLTPEEQQLRDSLINELINRPLNYKYGTPNNLTIAGYSQKGQFYLSRDAYEFKNIGNGKLLLKTSYSQIKNRWGAVQENYAYELALRDPIYSEIYSTTTDKKLTPIILYEEAKNRNSHTSEQLKKMEVLDGNNVLDGVENIKVVHAGSDKSGHNVEVSGEVAAAIASNETGIADPADLDYVGENRPQVTITTSITVPSSEEKKTIETYQAKNGLQGTETLFTVDISKNSEVTNSTYEVTKLPYEASVEFDLPAETLPSGYHYVGLREHTENDGPSVEKIPVKINGSKGELFTDKFSTFALAIEKDAPTPSKKESSSSSSSTKKTDNVVTCQMAGYPASYAWNESAKACQPGYIDNNGVFHLTAGNTNKRVSVVNTSDKGIGGMIAGLASSTVIAIAAAYLLKKYN